MKTNKGEKYYTRPYALWALLSSMIAIVSLGGVAYDTLQGGSLMQAFVTRGLVALTCILLSFWLSALVSWLLPVGLSKHGIRSYTVFGVYRSVEWAQISRVEATSICGIRYAKVYPATGGAPIWLPAFLTQRDRFVAQLRQHTAHAEAIEAALRGGDHAYHPGMPVPQ